MNADPRVPPKPTYQLAVDLPATGAIGELRRTPHWVAWSYDWDAPRGAWSKVPRNPSTGGKASVSSAATWSTYEAARACQLRNDFAGVGFVLTADYELIGGDLDGVLTDGVLAPWARDLVERGETYVERSPSGRGLRFFARGRLDAALKCDPAGVEVYGCGRYLTITGDRVDGAPDEINAAPDTLATLYARAARFRQAKGRADTGQRSSGFRADTGGGGFFRSVNQHALGDLGAWVRAVFPSAIFQPGTGAWRVPSRDLGRDLEEDLSLAPGGISDFGEERGLTAVDVVMLWGGASDAREAALWLCDRLGVDPATLGYAGRESGAGAGTGAGAGAGTGAGRESRFYSAAALKGKPVPPRQWLVHGLVPQKTVTLFSGDGGTGKSLLALQLAVAVAAGTAWIGKAAASGRVIVVSAEDDDEELHRRIDGILKHEGRDYDEISGLTLRSLAGEDALLAIETQLALVRSTLFGELDARAGDDSPALIVIDTLADVYPSNENDRAKVRQFVGILRGLALKRNCAVLLLGHPSLTGLASGTGTSGSTAWNNSVRSRLYLSRIVQDGYEPDPDKRMLATKKSNYGRVGGEISLKWEAGVFVAEAQPSGLDKLAAGAKAERVFLKLLDAMTEQGRRVNASGGAHYAPKTFSEHPDSEGVNKRAFRAAMETLLSSGRLCIEHEGPPSRRVSYIARGGK